MSGIMLIVLRSLRQHALSTFVTVLSTGRILVISANTNLISFSDDNGKTWYLQDPPPWDTLSTGTWPAIYQTGKNEISVISNFDGTLQMKFGHF